MKSPTIYYRNLAEQRAVAWFKRGHKRGQWLDYAIRDVAYDPYHANTDWRYPLRGGFVGDRIPRATWVYWSCCPYGAPDFNQKHQLAKLCIRRSVFFPDMAKRMGRRAWDDPMALYFPSKKKRNAA